MCVNQANFSYANFYILVGDDGSKKVDTGTSREISQLEKRLASGKSFFLFGEGHVVLMSFPVSTHEAELESAVVTHKMKYKDLEKRLNAGEHYSPLVPLPFSKCSLCVTVTQELKATSHVAER